MGLIGAQSVFIEAAMPTDRPLSALESGRGHKPDIRSCIAPDAEGMPLKNRSVYCVYHINSRIHKCFPSNNAN
jgi:hypothetical protein